jgi:hypothetical protein
MNSYFTFLNTLEYISYLEDHNDFHKLIFTETLPKFQYFPGLLRLNDNVNLEFRQLVTQSNKLF